MFVFVLYFLGAGGNRGPGGTEAGARGYRGNHENWDRGLGSGARAEFDRSPEADTKVGEPKGCFVPKDDVKQTKRF